MPLLRIAILECDNPLPQTKERYGGYGGVFEYLLKQGAQALQNPSLEPETDFEITKWQVEENPNQYPRLDAIDAILITGSKHDSFADNPWTNTLVAYTQKVLSQSRVRIIGVCYGHQIVARALCMKVGRNEDGWEAAVTDVNLSSRGKELFGKDTLAIHQMHRDIAFPISYPQGIENLGSSPVCAVQGMYAPGRLLTIQGHPEFNQEIVEEILKTRRAMGTFNNEAYKTYMKKVTLRHDGVVVAQAFLRFLLE